MSGIAYINGEFLKSACATISIFDRGFLFADSIYEVIPVYHSQPAFLDRHLKRLKQSLKKIRMNPPNLDYFSIFQELIKENGGGDLQIYLQITRGNEGKRKHDFPKGIEPTVIAFTLHTPFPSTEVKKGGLRAKLLEDNRWFRCDIKTTALLANVLLNDEAVSEGADTALLVRDGFLTEGSTCNIFLVDSKGLIKTPPLNNLCLPGITREVTIELIKSSGLPFSEEPIVADEIFNAQEVWVTSTTKEIYPVTWVDDQCIGNGIGGHCWSIINQKFIQLIKSL